MDRTNKIFTLVSLLTLGVLVLGGVLVYNEFEKSKICIDKKMIRKKHGFL